MHSNINPWFSKAPKWRTLIGVLVILSFSHLSIAQSTCSTPFFSEYIEGSGSNKGLEIFNPSSESIDLSHYEIQVFVNGATDPRFRLVPQGTLAPGETYTIANDRSDFADNADTTASVAGFNGDDAIILVDTMGNTLDAIGIVGEDPGSGWIVGDGSTANNTLIRTATITQGTTNWTQGATQWEVLGSDDFSNLGSHTFDASACEGGGPSGISIVINEFQPSGEDLVELKNYGTQSVDISEWWLCARFVYVQMNSDELTITGSTVMQPGDIITISGFELDDNSSDIGIYSTNSFASADAIIAFVQYGGSGIGRENVANEAGIWEAGDFIEGLGEGNSAEYTGANASGSELLASIDYVIQSQPTFGEENKLICTADAGGLTSTGIAEGDCEDGTVTLVAEPNGNASAPEGYTTAFVLTQGEELVIQQLSDTPSFAVSEDGIYTIHTLIFNGDSESPDFLDLEQLTIGESTGSDVVNLIASSEICASLDVSGALFDVACTPTDTCTANAGTLTAIPLGAEDCIPSGGSIEISATPGGDAVIPDEYQVIYLLTRGEELLIVNQGESPAFTVDEAGSYTIHTLVFTQNPELGDFLDISAITLNISTADSILNLIKDNDICADLDVTGASFIVEDCPDEICTLNAGSLTANPLSEEDCITTEGNKVIISANPNGDAVIDEGFGAVFLLTKGEDLLIVDIDTLPTFSIAEQGDYKIHTFLVNTDPESRDFVIIDTTLVIGQSTGADVINLIESTGICAALDVEGASISVDSCIILEPAPNCLFFSEYVEGSGDNKALEIYNACEEPVNLSNYEVLTFVNGATEPRFSFTPEGILQPGEVIVICNGGVDFPEQCDTTATVTEFNGDDAIALVNLTNGDTLDIIGVIGEDPGTSWEVDNGTTQNNTIIRKAFVTEGNTDWSIAQDEWLGIGEDVADSLGFHPHGEVPIAPLCEIDPGTLTPDDIGEGCVIPDSLTLTISASPNGDLILQEGFAAFYFLSVEAEEGKLFLALDNTPSFPIIEPGVFAIHTLVASIDSSTEDYIVLNDFLASGEKTVEEVANFIDSTGICAALDIEGASFEIPLCPIDSCIADAGTLSANELGEEDCLSPDGEPVNISATPNGDAIIEPGYGRLYVLTTGEELLITNVSSTPSFDVDEPGDYRIHTLVLNSDMESPDFIALDTAIVLGESTGADIVNLIISSGICADLDVIGASFSIMECPDTTSCTAFAGTMSAANDPDCIGEDSPNLELEAVSAEAIIPEEYTQLFVLTRGEDLIIQNTSSEPTFTVDEVGLYRIHSLVYDPRAESDDFLDLSVIAIGETTGAQVASLIDEAGICADLDVTGISFMIDSCDVVSPAPNCLFFSEYVEGSGDNKALEIYNACNEAVDLSNYEVLTYVNGATEPRFSFSPEGTLEPGAVIVICNGGVDFLDACDTTATVTEFNGDDAIALVNLTTGDTLDIIGVIGEDPGSFWEVDNGTTQNNTIIRKAFVTEGNTDWVSAQNEWLGIGEDVADSLGFHPHGDAPIDPTCDIDPGTLTAVELGEEDCIILDSTTVVLNATPNGDIALQEGFAPIYLLSAGEDLLLIEIDTIPSFEVFLPGLYTIHTLVINTDPQSEDFMVINSLELGVNTGVEALELIDSTGICAALDAAGAVFEVELCQDPDCEAEAGTLTANELDADDCIDENNPSVSISAIPNGDQVVPEGSILAWILTTGQDLELLSIDTTSEFEVTEPGLYTIHTFVLDTTAEELAMLDTTEIVDLAEAFETAGEVLGFLTDLGICFDIDVEGAPIAVEACPGETECEAEAGTLTAIELGDEDCLDDIQTSVTLEAIPNGDQVVPEGSIMGWVLTTGTDFELVAADEVPSFEVTEPGLYTIHTLVIDTTLEELAMLDTAEIEEILEDFETAADVIAFLEFLEVCADVDLEGAVFEVESCPVEPGGECPEVCTLSNWNGNLAGPDYERPLNMAVVLHISPLDPYLMQGDYSNYQRFVWETAGELTRYDDQLVITGTVVSKVDSGAQFDLELILVGGQNWEEFSSTPGRGEYIAAKGIGDAFMDWEYWYLSDESKMTGKGSLEGIELSLYHVPKDSSKAFQIGMGGNGFDLDEGLGGWFGYTGVFNGEEFKAVGDITVDIDGCTKEDTCGATSTAIRDIRTEAVSDLLAQNSSTLANSRRFDIFPNPSERFVNIRDRKPQQGTYTFKVFDLNGRTLQTQRISNFNGNYLLDASKLPSNVHMVQIISPDGGLKTLKFSIK